MSAWGWGRRWEEEEEEGRDRAGGPREPRLTAPPPPRRNGLQRENPLPERRAGGQQVVVVVPPEFSSVSLSPFPSVSRSGSLRAAGLPAGVAGVVVPVDGQGIPPGAAFPAAPSASEVPVSNGLSWAVGASPLPAPDAVGSSLKYLTLSGNGEEGQVSALCFSTPGRGLSGGVMHRV